MKNLVKEVAITIIFIVIALNVFNWLESENYKRVAKTCDKENIVVAYTNDGDRYYTCNK